MEMLYHQSGVFKFTQNGNSVFQMNYLSALVNYYKNKPEPENSTKSIPTTQNY